MFEPCPACFQRGLRSDRHGVIERDPTLASRGTQQFSAHRHTHVKSLNAIDAKIF